MVATPILPPISPVHLSRFAACPAAVCIPFDREQYRLGSIPEVVKSHHERCAVASYRLRGSSIRQLETNRLKLQFPQNTIEWGRGLAALRVRLPLTSGLLVEAGSKATCYCRVWRSGHGGRAVKREALLTAVGLRVLDSEFGTKRPDWTRPNTESRVPVSHTRTLSSFFCTRNPCVDAARDVRHHVVPVSLLMRTTTDGGNRV
ncbi:hypothetical protein N656DRAFT_617591 [Canariomyces notabilis]|uniref:Uncharacterized protein n=1 Tax=Canariomyces notabilis TaxID=2074819 RepID=A0AAN6YUE2_9PEZI|nr:hypothetical protein N656DRAFT_617591 [Canariomyces arenarius]